MRRLVLLALALAAACSDALEQTSSAGQVIGVVNASDRTLSVISATDFTVSTRDWQSASASPQTIDGRGHVFVVPLGAADAVGVSLLFTCPPSALALCARPDYVLPLAAGSGATGAVAFHPTGGRLLIASALEGILEVNTSVRAVTRGPGNGIKPGGQGVSGLAIDLRGRVYAVQAAFDPAVPEFCAVRGVVHVLTAPPDYREVHTV